MAKKDPFRAGMTYTFDGVTYAPGMIIPDAVVEKFGPTKRYGDPIHGIPEVETPATQEAKAEIAPARPLSEMSEDELDAFAANRGVSFSEGDSIDTKIERIVASFYGVDQAAFDEYASKRLEDLKAEARAEVEAEYEGYVKAEEGETPGMTLGFQLDDLKKDTLIAIAKDLGIPYSGLDKAELAGALYAYSGVADESTEPTSEEQEG